VNSLSLVSWYFCVRNTEFFTAIGLTMTAPIRDALTIPSSLGHHIDPYNPSISSYPSNRPYVTLTFATSLDSNLSISPGVQTALSGPDSKVMTHYLRSKHDAILIGVGTAIADNPSLNCRIEGVGGYGGAGLVGQPRPVVLDPSARWDFTAESKCIKLAREGRGRGPLLLACRDVPRNKKDVLESVGGKVICLESSSSDSDKPKITWKSILTCLFDEGIKSVMIEGGGSVINDLLSPQNIGLVDSVIVTIAPTWLGQDAVQVCPPGRVDERGVKIPVGRLKDVKWVPLGDDVVLCGRPMV
jgi:2,5-diamino-6-(ribosylamino)-4(3H)-pyrimidinone 5'-phosphate reductase